MNSQLTPVEAPIAIQIADDVRLQIERGDLAAGTPIPTLQTLSERWGCSIASARTAVQLLKQQGLISGGRGRAPVVRSKPVRVVRSSDRHQIEKDLVLSSESERRGLGQTEIDMSTKIADLIFTAHYDIGPAGAELASALNVSPDADTLKRVYEVREPNRRTLRMWSVSYIPKELVVDNPALLDETNEPWPGGTQHQLYTVGIEIDKIIDEVTARMPTTVEAKQWDLEEGIPMLRVRRISVDATGRVVEVSDADFPADRTELRFVTRLNPWGEKVHAAR
jgi:GntR family transcriptional regulator